MTNTNSSLDRRQFLITSGAALLAPVGRETLIDASSQQAPKKIRIGIIGAENTHTVTYGRMFNQDRKFPDCEVVGVWGETAEFAKQAAEKGRIPWIVKDPGEFMGKIDALIVDHRHAKYHLEAAWPFVEAGIPTFIDKPFCYRVSEGRKFLEMARTKKTPVTSFSTGARGERIIKLKDQVKAIPKIHHVISAGHCDVDSPYGGVFFYGVHQVERLMAVFDENIQRVRVSSKGGDASATLVFASGLLATVIMSKGRPPFEFAVITDQGIRKLESESSGESLTPYEEMVQMFRDGKEPRSHQSILRGIAILEALERSVTSDRWEEVES
jgi:predicted dehydrogenase